MKKKMFLYGLLVVLLTNVGFKIDADSQVVEDSTAKIGFLPNPTLRDNTTLQDSNHYSPSHQGKDLPKTGDSKNDDNLHYLFGGYLLILGLLATIMKKRKLSLS